MPNYIYKLGAENYDAACFLVNDINVLAIDEI